MPGVFRKQAETGPHLTPYLLEILARRLRPLLVEVVEAPGARLLVGDEAGLVQQAEMP